MTSIWFFEDVRERLVSYFNRRGCGEHSEEFAQETLLRFWRKYGEADVENEERLRIIYGFAKNVFRESWDERGRIVQMDPELPDPADPRSVNVLTSLIQDEHIARFRACCCRLKRFDQQLLEAYGNAADRRALAAELNLSIEALRFRVWHIRQKVLRCLRVRPQIQENAT